MPVLSELSFVKYILCMPYTRYHLVSYFFMSALYEILSGQLFFMSALYVISFGQLLFMPALYEISYGK